MDINSGYQFQYLDLTFTDQPKLVVHSGVNPALYSNCYHQLIHCKLNDNIEYLLLINVICGTTVNQANIENIL